MTDPERLAREIAIVREALAFFASCIKSGEPWTARCEDVYARAIQSEVLTRPSPGTEAEVERLAAIIEETRSEEKPSAYIARAAISAMSPPSTRAQDEGGGWQPIETAPKDGRHIIFGRTPPWSATGNVCVGFWHQGRWQAIDGGGQIVEDHWAYWTPHLDEPQP